MPYLTFTGKPSAGTITVAASDASGESKRAAKYVCDGTSDQSQIQAAIDALPSVGGVVQLSEGTFTVSASIQLNSGTILRGAGRGRWESDTGTTIALANGVNDNVIELSASTVTHVEISHLNVSGNKANNTSGNGISLDRTGLVSSFACRDLIKDVVVLEAAVFGVLILKPSGTGGGAADLIDVLVHDAGDDGFRVQGSDTFATHCIALGCGGDGWQFASGGANAQISNCKSDSCDGWGFNVSGSPRIKFFGVEALNNAFGGITINQDDCTLSGALLIDNGRNGSPDPGLNIQSGCQGLVATGMTITEIQGDSRMSVGVQVDSGATDILVQGMVKNYVTAYYNASSAGSTVNNSGLVDGDA